MSWQRHTARNWLNGSGARSETSLPVIVQRLGIQYLLTVELRGVGRHRLDENTMRRALELASQAFEQNLVSLMTPLEGEPTPRARSPETEFGSGTTTTSIPGA